MSPTSIVQSHLRPHTDPTASALNSKSTPTKRKRSVQDSQRAHKALTNAEKSTQHNKHNNATTSDRSLASSAELWKWTLTNGVPATCFVKDVLDMHDSDDSAHDFFWLGRYPCRRVCLVGMVVGVTTFEKRRMYTIDDGTAVIEGYHIYPDSAPSMKSKKPTSAGVSTSGSTAPPKLPHSKNGASSNVKEPPPPIADVGVAVRVVGRVVKWHTSKQLMIDSIEPCHSANDEASHWRTVLEHHRTKYDIALGPFVIPALSTSVATTTASSVLPESDPQTPKASRIINTANYTGSSSHYSSASELSPTKSTSGSTAQQTLKLRYPSRLHSRELTENTFRIYIKYYMDNARPYSARSVLANESDDEWMPATPTKVGHRNELPHQDNCTTPKASRQPAVANNVARTSVSQSAGNVTASRLQGTGAAATTYAYTLSHLRRVPALHLLASRVVDVERRRRARASRKANQGTHIQPPPSDNHGEDSAPKMKRLFQHAIRKMYDEGAIVLSDGSAPVLAVSDTCDQEHLWRRRSSSADVDDEGVEELGTFLEDAIETLMTRPPRNQPGRRAPVTAPTADDIGNCLRRKDARWARLSDWSIKECLEWLAAEGRVWHTGGGRWERCL